MMNSENRCPSETRYIVLATQWHCVSSSYNQALWLFWRALPKHQGQSAGCSATAKDVTKTRKPCGEKLECCTWLGFQCLRTRGETNEYRTGGGIGRSLGRRAGGRGLSTSGREWEGWRGWREEGSSCSGGSQVSIDGGQGQGFQPQQAWFRLTQHLLSRAVASVRHCITSLWGPQWEQ